MAENTYPSVGLEVDFDDFRRLDQAIDRGIASYGRLRKAAQDAGKVDDRDLETQAARRERVIQRSTRAQEMSTRQIMAAQRSLSQFQAQQDALTLRSRQAMWAQQTREAQRAAAEERAIQQRQLREFRSMMDQRIAAGRRAADEERRQAERTAALRARMARQQLQEEQRAASARQSYLAWAARNNAAALAAGPAASTPGLTAQVMNALSQSASRFTGTMGNMLGVLHRVRVAMFDVRTAVALLMAGLAVGPIVRWTDAMTALQARIGFFAESQRDVPYTFQAIFDTAQRARAPLEAVATLYTRLAPLASQLGKSQLELLRVTETVQKAIALGGATMQEAASSSQQLAQALSSNRLGGDELRSLAENAPILLGAIARELNMSTGEFIKWAHQGKANAAIVIEALENASARIDDLFSRFPVTISQGITVVGNAMQRLVGEVMTATQVGQRIGGMMMEFAAFLEAPNTIRTATAAVQGLITAFETLGKAVSLLMNVLPVVAAFLAVMVTRTVLATTAVRNLGLVWALLAATMGRGTAAMIIATTAANAAVARLGIAMRSLWAFIGGPLGAALIGLVAGLTYVRTATLSAQEAIERFDSATDGARSSLERLLAWQETYGGNVKETSDVLLRLNNVTEDQVRHLDAAGRAAYARAVNERTLTAALLERAAAESTSTAAKLRGSAMLYRVEEKFRGAIANISIGQGRTINRQRSQDAANIANFQESLAAQLDAQAPVLRDAARNLLSTDPDIKLPEGGGEGGLPGTSTADGKGLDGAINRIARLRAEVAGLRAQIEALDVNPLADIAARIKAAGDEAAARYTAGKAAEAGFATQARALAMQKEELEIRLELTKASIEQRRRAEEELATLRLTAAGRQRAEGIMQEYLRTADDGYAAYIRAVNAARDADTDAAVAANNLRIARQFGVTALNDIAAAYRKASGATQEEAQALENHWKATAAAEEATIRATAATEAATDAARDHTAALRELAEMRWELANLERSADQTPETRAASERAARIERELMIAAQRDGLEISREELRLQAEILALEQERRAEMARLKINIQDDIRNAFLETGRLDFGPLRERLTRELRRAVYDALIAKPITIVVNAAVNVLTNALQKALSDIVGSIGSANGGAGGFLGSLFGIGSSIFGGGNSAGFDQGVWDSMGKAAGSLVQTTQSVNSIMRSLPNIFRQGVNMMAYAGIGNTLAGALGGRQNTGSMVGSAIGAIGGGWLAGTAAGASLGSMLGIAGSALGPIGMVMGAVLGSLVGGLFGGKPSNNAAIATISGGSFSISGNKRTDETTKMATAAAQAIIAGQDALRNAGLTLNDGVRAIDIGVRDMTHIFLSSGQELRSAVGDPAAAAETALKALLQSATYVNDAQKALVDSALAAGKGFDDIVKMLEKWAEAQKIAQSVADEILRYTDPQAYDVLMLERQQEARRKEIEQLGTEGYLTAEQLASLRVQLEQLDALELADVLSRFADAVDSAAQAAYDQATEAVDQARQALVAAYNAERREIEQNINTYSRIADSLRTFLDSLDSGPLSGRGLMDLADITRADLMAASAATDAETMERIPELARGFLEAQRAVAATQMDYLREVALARNVATLAEANARQQVSIGERQLEALNAQVEGLITVNESVLSVAVAIANLQAALAAQAKAAEVLNPGRGVNGEEYLRANPDLMDAWQRYLLGDEQLRAWGFEPGWTMDQFGQYHWERTGQYEGRKRYVGDPGVPLVRTAAESYSLTGVNDNDAVDEIAGLRDDFDAAVGILVQIAANTGGATNYLRSFNYNGMPPERETIEP